MESILIVDDDISLCTALKDELLEVGYSVDYVNNGDDAFQYLSGNDVDLLLLDLKMPGKDGFDVLKELNEQSIRSKIIVLTAYADVKTLSEDAGGAPVFMHPRITPKNGDKVKDITGRHDIIKSFGLTISDLPGSGGGSVLIYSDINDGMLFTGADAEGSSYDSDLSTFERPKLESKNDEFGLAQAWGAFVLPFTYLFPLCGKPGFNLDEGAQQDILMKLSRIQE